MPSQRPSRPQRPSTNNNNSSNGMASSSIFTPAEQRFIGLIMRSADLDKMVESFDWARLHALSGNRNRQVVRDSWSRLKKKLGGIRVAATADDGAVQTSRSKTKNNNNARQRSVAASRQQQRQGNGYHDVDDEDEKEEDHDDATGASNAELSMEQQRIRAAHKAAMIEAGLFTAADMENGVGPRGNGRGDIVDGDDEDDLSDWSEEDEDEDRQDEETGKEGELDDCENAARRDEAEEMQPRAGDERLTTHTGAITRREEPDKPRCTEGDSWFGSVASSFGDSIGAHRGTRTGARTTSRDDTTSTSRIGGFQSFFDGPIPRRDPRKSFNHDQNRNNSNDHGGGGGGYTTGRPSTISTTSSFFTSPSTNPRDPRPSNPYSNPSTTPRSFFDTPHSYLTPRPQRGSFLSDDYNYHRSWNHSSPQSSYPRRFSGNSSNSRNSYHNHYLDDIFSTRPSPPNSSFFDFVPPSPSFSSSFSGSHGQKSGRASTNNNSRSGGGGGGGSRGDGGDKVETPYEVEEPPSPVSSRPSSPAIATTPKEKRRKVKIKRELGSDGEVVEEGDGGVQTVRAKRRKRRSGGRDEEVGGGVEVVEVAEKDGVAVEIGSTADMAVEVDW